MIFESFGKIGRLKRDCIVTEKIDGSNGQVAIVPVEDDNDIFIEDSVALVDGFAIYAGSRNRWIKPGKKTDNFGFAEWVKDHAAELVTLGPGRHWGEWWGQGIQRTYDMHERRFSLFNAHRWKENRPACCYVVPTLYQGAFDTFQIDAAALTLMQCGSQAAPGFMKPEGIIIYHGATKTTFKKTIEDDDVSKTEALAA